MGSGDLHLSEQQATLLGMSKSLPLHHQNHSAKREQQPEGGEQEGVRHHAAFAAGGQLFGGLTLKRPAR